MHRHVRPFFDASSSTFSYVIDDGAGTCAVIDPVLGLDQASGRTAAAPLEAMASYLEAKSLQVQWLLETHAHADHLSGAPWLQQRFGGTLAVGSGITRVQRDFRGIFNAHDMAIDGSQFNHLFGDTETFAIGQLQARALHVPGHTPADVAYQVLGRNGEPDAVFVGDTIFMPDIGTARCDFPGGDARMLFRSIRRLMSLPAATRLYLCHDYPTGGREAHCFATVEAQRAANIHVHDGVSEDDFVALRTARDATLALPTLMLPSIQVNMRAGRMPPAENNGTSYLKIPIDLI
ncbi:MAG TPA: MBL fold metallo-hydrolase [Reyranella sp.]|nr:MBL fold metallo-hydrolase [Reyranella sp.]